MIGLNRASEGSAAILKFFPHSCAIYQEAPDLNDAAVVQEETVVATEEKPMPLNLLDIASNCNSSEELMEAALVPIPWDDVVRISEATMQQLLIVPFLVVVVVVTFLLIVPFLVVLYTLSSFPIRPSVNCFSSINI